MNRYPPNPQFQQQQQQQQQPNVQQQVQTVTVPQPEIGTTFDTSTRYSMESVYLQTPNPESDKEFDLSNLGIDLLSTAPLLPSVYYVASDAPMATQGQYPASIYFPETVETNPPSSRIKQFNEFMLFFIFYMYAGDKLQVEASSELKKRNFTYDAEKKAWRNQGGKYFDPNTWSYVDASQWGRVPRFA